MHSPFETKIFSSSKTSTLTLLKLPLSFFEHIKKAVLAAFTLYLQRILTTRKARRIKICIRVKRTRQAWCRFLDSRFNSSRTQPPSTGHCYDGISPAVIAFLTTDSRPASRRPGLSLKRASYVLWVFFSDRFLKTSSACRVHFASISRGYGVVKSFHKKVPSLFYLH